MMLDLPGRNVITHQRFNQRANPSEARASPIAPLCNRDIDHVRDMETVMIVLEIKQRLSVLRERHGKPWVWECVADTLEDI